MNPSSGKQLPQDWERDARERWPQLTDDDYRSVGGQPDRLIATLQKRYSVTRDDAEEQVKLFCSSCGGGSESSGSKSFGSQGSRTGNTGQENNPRYGEQSQGSREKQKSESGGQNPSGQPGQQGNRPRQTSGS